MQHSRSFVAGDGLRRLILGGAFAVGLAVAAAPHTTIVRAADLPGAAIAQADTSKVAPATPPSAPAAPSAAAAQPSGAASQPPGAPNAQAPKAPKANADDADADADADDADDTDATASGSVTADNHHRIIIQKGDKKIRIEGLGRDREYDSFQQFVHDAPWLAGLVFLATLLVFLVPLLIVVLLIWYKLRKNRIANETMLKLAERGVVPPATAMDAVASGTAASVVAAAAPPPGNPAYDQARYLHRRTVWSDLRKGVILCAVGLGLSFWSMLDDGTPNSVGLILLFVGLGYCLLWFFEDRTTTTPRNPGTPPPGSV
jgi:hypothetical protein